MPVEREERGLGRILGRLGGGRVREAVAAREVAVQERDAARAEAGRQAEAARQTDEGRRSA